MDQRMKAQRLDLEERVVHINRVAKVVKVDGNFASAHWSWLETVRVMWE